MIRNFDGMRNLEVTVKSDSMIDWLNKWGLNKSFKEYASFVIIPNSLMIVNSVGVVISERIAADV